MLALIFFSLFFLFYLGLVLLLVPSIIRGILAAIREE